MRRLNWVVAPLAFSVAAIGAAGCGRAPTQGVVSTQVDAADETTAVPTEGVSDSGASGTPGDTSEVSDVQGAEPAIGPAVELCGLENDQLPNDGEECEVEGASVCGKADAVTKATPWKLKGPDAPSWAAVVPDWMCWRPQILRCAKQVGGGLRWVGEWCSMPYQPDQSDQSIHWNKDLFHCRSLDGVASCCPRWETLSGSYLMPCDEANLGKRQCTFSVCGIAANQSDLTPQAQELLSKSSVDLERCPMWWPTLNQCGIVECAVKNPSPSRIDAPYLCQTFSGGCNQIDDFSFACDESGCGGLDPPLPQGMCKGYHKDAWSEPDTSP